MYVIKGIVEVLKGRENWFVFGMCEEVYDGIIRLLLLILYYMIYDYN